MRDAKKRKIKPQKNTVKSAGKASDIKPAAVSAVKSEEIFKKLLMVTSDAVIITDIAGKIIYLSDRAIDLYNGKNKDEFIGKSSFEFIPAVDRKKAANNMKRLLKEGYISGVEYNIGIKDGKNSILRSNTTLINDASGSPALVLSTVRDVTKGRAVEASLGESEKNYQAVFNGVSDAIVVIDMKTLNLLDANDWFMKVRNITREQVKKVNVADFGKKGEEGFEPEDAVRQVKAAIARGSHVFDWKETKKGGRAVWTQISLRRTMIGGRDCLLGIIRDVTEKIRTEQELRQSNLMFKKIMEGIISAMEKLVEKKDMYTVGHQRRTAELARAIGATMGLAKEQLECIYIAAIIHDVGKIFVSGAILNKKDKLTDYEYDIIKKHPDAGYEILKTIDFPWPLADIVLQHHERLDGSGYPYGLKGDRIYLESRIISVADVVEAITFERPYRPALGIDRALEEIENKKGVLYDPEVVDICVELFREKKFSWS
jgi:PAS domain S-box-containing protein